MKTARFTAALALALLIVLSACSAGKGGSVSESTSNQTDASSQTDASDSASSYSGITSYVFQTPEPSSDVSIAASASAAPAVNDPVEDALAQYRTKVSNAASQFEEFDTEYCTGNLGYALVQLQAADTVPTLLLSMETNYGVNEIQLFQYDPQSGKIIHPSESLEEGAAETSWFRGSIALRGDGNGLEITQWSGGSGDTDVSRVTLSGNTLNWENIWSGRIDLMPNLPESRPIDWHSTSDTSALQSWTPATVPTPAPAPAPEVPTTTALPTDGNRIVLTGTLRVYSHNELVALQEIQEPWPDDGRKYWVIVLDQPRALKGGCADSYRTDTATMISVPPLPESYIGQHIIFSLEPSNIWWSSGVELPMDEPFADDIHIISPSEYRISSQNYQDGEYLLPTDTQYISESDLYAFTKDEVSLILNEIYARHGCTFKKEKYQTYFGSKSWYYPVEGRTASTFDSGLLNDCERKNIDTIVNYMKDMGWR